MYECPKYHCIYSSPFDCPGCKYKDIPIEFVDQYPCSMVDRKYSEADALADATRKFRKACKRKQQVKNKLEG